MPNLSEKSGPPSSAFRKPVSINTIRSPDRASTKPKGRSSTPASFAPLTRSTSGWSLDRANSMTWTSHRFPGAVVMEGLLSAFGNNAPKARKPDGHDQYGALEDVL